MDPLSDFLDGPRARGAFLLQVVMAPPWSLVVADGAPLTVVAVTRGACWFLPQLGPPARMTTGDVLLVRGPAPYRMASAPGLEPAIVIGPDQRCTGVGGRDLSAELRTGVGTWGNDASGPDAMVVGTYRSAGEVGKILIDALPCDVVVGLGRKTVLDLIADELERDALAQASLLDRLLDVLLIAVVRAWAAAAESTPATWLGAARDPEIGAAVRLIHQAPERAWTVGSLAVAVGVSRASLARRFHDVVGTPPMTYLAQWRLAVAADLLADPVITLTAISRRVGYGSPFSFSAAFKKRYGVSPQHYRRGVDPGGAPTAQTADAFV